MTTYGKDRFVQLMSSGFPEYCIFCPQPASPCTTCTSYFPLPNSFCVPSLDHIFQFLHPLLGEINIHRLLRIRHLAVCIMILCVDCEVEACLVPKYLMHTNPIHPSQSGLMDLSSFPPSHNHL